MSRKDGSNEKSQIDKFKEAAHDLECDDDEQRFKERLGKLVKPAKGHVKSGTTTSTKS